MPIFLSPATPAELLSSIVAHQSYPTTLVICCPRQLFQDALLHNVAASLSLHDDDQPQDAASSTDTQKKKKEEEMTEALVAASLHQTAIARHIRVVFTPTVSHLRAYLSVFDPADSKVPPPPGYVSPSHGSDPPLLLLFGFLDAHRDTSEWNAQGISTTAALLVDAADRAAYKPVVIEPRGDDGLPDLESLLSERVPLLGRGVGNEEVWSGRSVEIRRILGRWFSFHDNDGTLDEHANKNTS